MASVVSGGNRVAAALREFATKRDTSDMLEVGFMDGATEADGMQVPVRRVDQGVPTDSVYVTTVLSGVSQQYVALLADGIDNVSPARTQLSAPSIAIQASNDISITAGGALTNSARAIALDRDVMQGEEPNGDAASMAGPPTMRQDVMAASKNGHDHTHRDSQRSTTSQPL
ncbi:MULTISPECIES: hypothetical protein [Burkholderia]|uniref:hypothetical protein n=1 Tax=Burkholderia TaxID=32008 RepID=UPI000679E07C|nr:MULTISPECIES: hypothetical protein [Burkholderia]KWU25594.1 hypothetical protein AS149_29805 [Burkholderia cenocepacia]OXI65937.1 hypothetical protein CFB44_33265 [Burkholderia sp. AU31280]QRR18507.1 hypothetical protein GJG85_34595 [Burkholderia sp. MS389]CAG2377086.1 phage P2 baseplate assembly protein gpV [Burkholderia cenocepacia]CAG2377217.1 phage P2 baseplate assembly protein gpV [Burkholderia cenocepacia]